MAVCFAAVSFAAVSFEDVSFAAAFGAALTGSFSAVSFAFGSGLGADLPVALRNSDFTAFLIEFLTLTAVLLDAPLLAILLLAALLLAALLLAALLLAALLLAALLLAMKPLSCGGRTPPFRPPLPYGLRPHLTASPAGPGDRITTPTVVAAR